MKKAKKLKAARITILLFFLIVSSGISLFHAYDIIPRFMNGDAICPFGGLETLNSLILENRYLRRVAASNIIILAGVMFLALIFRRSFCGTICPLGTLQETMTWLRNRIGLKRETIPAKIDRIFRLLKYAVLVWFLWQAWKMGDMVIRIYDPWVAWNHITAPQELLEEIPWGAAILIIAFAGSFFYDRFFCKYLCPMGAFLGIFAKLTVFKIHRNEESCVSCGECNRVCPTNINVATCERVESSECLSCNQCVTVCPRRDTLVWKRGAKKISPAFPAIIPAATLLLAVIVSSLTGDFVWAESNLASRTEGLDYSGALDLIKGKTTGNEIVETFPIDREAFKQRFSLTDEDMQKSFKAVRTARGSDDMDSMFTFIDDIRNYIAAQLELSPPEEGGGEH